MISNLLKNAIVHNVEGGTVTVTVNSSSITVENTSTVHALDADQIFKRFYKNSDANTSTGLGLALVKSIADIYGFTVEYSYNGKHVFVISV
jgi:signal transduction histidine kinase